MQPRFSEGRRLLGYGIGTSLLIGLWWWVASIDTAGTAGIKRLIIFLPWFAIVAFGFSRKWTAFRSFGGGFVAASAAIALGITFIGSEGLDTEVRDAAVTSRNTNGQLQESKEQKSRNQKRSLERSALALLKDPQYGLGGMCDKVYDEKLVNVSHGTLRDQYGQNTRFPGLVAQVDYKCVNALTGEREHETQFWVILGYDDIADRFRCLKFAGRPVIVDLQRQCDFQLG